MPESLVEVSGIFLVKSVVLWTQKTHKKEQHTNATENNTFG